MVFDSSVICFRKPSEHTKTPTFFAGPGLKLFFAAHHAPTISTDTSRDEAKKKATAAEKLVYLAWTNR